MSRQTHHTQALSDLWAILCRYPWKFLLPAFAVTALILGGCLFLPRKYKAEAIFERRTDMVLWEIMERGAPKSFQDPRQSLTEELIGQVAVDQLLNQLRQPVKVGGQMRTLTLDRDQLKGDLSRKVNVYYDIASAELDRVRVSYITEDPVVARLAVNMMVQNYLDGSRQRIEARLKQSAGFFQNEVARSRKLIEDLENRKLQYEIQHAGLLPDSPNSLQSNLTEMQNRLATLQQTRDQAILRLTTLRQARQEAPATLPTVMSIRNPELLVLENRQRDLTSRLTESLSVYKMTDKHPDVVALREQLQQVNLQIAKTPQEVVSHRQEVPNPKRADLELQIAQADMELQLADKQVEGVRKQLGLADQSTSQLFPVRSEYVKLNREVDQAQRQLTFWEDNLRRVQMASAAETGNRGIQLAFIKPCGRLVKPVSPNLSQSLMLAVALGLMAGGLMVFLAYKNDETFADSRDLGKAWEIPVLGGVSELVNAQQRRLRLLRQRLLYPLNIAAMSAVVLLMAGLLYLDLEKPGLFKVLIQSPLKALHQSPVGTAYPAMPTETHKE